MNLIFSCRAIRHVTPHNEPTIYSLHPILKYSLSNRFELVLVQCIYVYFDIIYVNSIPLVLLLLLRQQTASAKLSCSSTPPLSLKKCVCRMCIRSYRVWICWWCWRHTRHFIYQNRIGSSIIPQINFRPASVRGKISRHLRYMLHVWISLITHKNLKKIYK